MKQKQLKDKVLTIRLNERTCQILEELKEDTGSYSMADIIRQAIYNFYGKFHKDYAPKSIGASTKAEKYKPTKEFITIKDYIKFSGHTPQNVYRWIRDKKISPEDLSSKVVEVQMLNKNLILKKVWSHKQLPKEEQAEPKIS